MEIRLKKIKDILERNSFQKTKKVTNLCLVTNKIVYLRNEPYPVQ